MMNIDIQSPYCIISNRNNSNSRRLTFKGSDQTGIYKRRTSHKWYEDDKWRLDIFYNNDGTINSVLLFLIDNRQLKLKQENLYKKDHLWKIIHYNNISGYDTYIFKDDLLMEEIMSIYKENINDGEGIREYHCDWNHTRKFYDYENRIIKIYSYNPANNRIYNYDRIEKMS